MNDPIEYKGEVKFVSADEPEKVRPKVVLGAPRFGMSIMHSERLMSDILKTVKVDPEFVLKHEDTQFAQQVSDTHFAQQLGDAYVESVISDLDDAIPSKHPKSRRVAKTAEERKRIKRQRKQKHR
jgi:hypothetical protein